MSSFQEIVTGFYIENTGLSIYIGFLIIFLLCEVIFLLKINWIFYKQRKKLARRNIKSDTLLQKIINRYKKLKLYSPERIDLDGFIKNIIREEKQKLFRGLRFVENSSSLYILMGLLGSIILLAFILLGREFSGLETLNRVYGRLNLIILPSVTGVILSILIKIFLKIFSTGKSIDLFIDEMKTYLETEIVSEKDIPGTGNKEIKNLITFLESSLSGFEDSLTGKIDEIKNELEEIKTILTLREERRESKRKEEKRESREHDKEESSRVD